MSDNGLSGRPVRVVNAFDSRVMCSDEDHEPHAVDNLVITVLFWELDDLDEEHEIKHREARDLIFERTRELDRMLSGTGLPGPRGHVVVQRVLHSQPQVSSICWN